MYPTHTWTIARRHLAASNAGLASTYLPTGKQCGRPPRSKLQDMVLRWLPVTHNKAVEPEAAAAAAALGDSPIQSVLRSKGFMWLSNKHTTAFYWSHAGQHFEIREEGDWWAAVPDEEWPDAASGQRAIILSDFAAEGGAGDRRQEIVFIGAGMDEAKICAQLDSALLSDEEMALYTSKWASLPDPTHEGAPGGSRGGAGSGQPHQ